MRNKSGNQNLQSQKIYIDFNGRTHYSVNIDPQNNTPNRKIIGSGIYRHRMLDVNDRYIQIPYWEVESM